MMLGRLNRPAALAPLFGLALVLSAITFAACGGSDARRGGQGDSCEKTDDCESPLSCVDKVCGGKSSGATTGTGATTGSGGGGGTSSSSTSSTSSTTGSTSTTATTGSTGSGGNGTGGEGTGGSVPLDSDACHMCLAQVCASEEAACMADSDCYAIEGCIESQCGNLSAIGSSDEGQCQVNCQSKHAAAKQIHLNYAICADDSNCAACSSNPFDWNACRAKADAGACASALSDCSGSADCVAYQNCVASCTSLSECIACGTGTTEQAGQALAFAYETCIGTQCLAEAWLK